MRASLQLLLPGRRSAALHNPQRTAGGWRILPFSSSHCYSSNGSPSPSSSSSRSAAGSSAASQTESHNAETPTNSSALHDTSSSSSNSFDFLTTDDEQEKEEMESFARDFGPFNEEEAEEEEEEEEEEEGKEKPKRKPPAPPSGRSTSSSPSPSAAASSSPSSPPQPIDPYFRFYQSYYLRRDTPQHVPTGLIGLLSEPKRLHTALGQKSFPLTVFLAQLCQEHWYDSLPRWKVEGEGAEGETTQSEEELIAPAPVVWFQRLTKDPFFCMRHHDVLTATLWRLRDAQLEQEKEGGETAKGEAEMFDEWVIHQTAELDSLYKYLGSATANDSTQAPAAADPFQGMLMDTKEYPELAKKFSERIKKVKVLAPSDYPIPILNFKAFCAELLSGPPSSSPSSGATKEEDDSPPTIYECSPIFMDLAAQCRHLHHLDAGLAVQDLQGISVAEARHQQQQGNGEEQELNKDATLLFMAETFSVNVLDALWSQFWVTGDGTYAKAVLNLSKEFGSNPNFGPRFPKDVDEPWQDVPKEVAKKWSLDTGCRYLFSKMATYSLLHNVAYHPGPIFWEVLQASKDDEAEDALQAQAKWLLRHPRFQEASRLLNEEGNNNATDTRMPHPAAIWEKNAQLHKLMLLNRKNKGLIGENEQQWRDWWRWDPFA
ncbi:Liprin-beta-2 [Balamuthia mandrillaris]